MNEGLTAQKAAIRKEAFARRKVAHSARTGNETRHLSALLERLNPKVLAGYLPIRTEIDPLPAMEAWLGRSVLAVPMITAPATALTFVEWAPGMALADNGFGTRVPENPRPVIPDVLIVPLVGFSRDGGRLGYGGGFYDRSLEALRAAGDIQAIGFAYSDQEFTELPLEKTDQRLNFIATNSEIISL